MSRTKPQGQYRKLTPQEIGRAVTAFRSVLGMKQMALALDAGVDQRTVQRIERGERVNEHTLQKVAKAFGIRERAFLGPRYVSTSEEAIAKVKKMLSHEMLIETREFTTTRDCDAVLRTDGYIVNDRYVSFDLADTVEMLRVKLTVCGDSYNDVSHTDRLEPCRLILDSVQKIETMGYRTRYAVYTTDDRREVSVLVFLPKTDEQLSCMRHFVVPRNFAKMMRETFGRKHHCGGRRKC
jgi:transcriptional regulator with XRE-family HTH domain